MHHLWYCVFVRSEPKAYSRKLALLPSWVEQAAFGYISAVNGVLVRMNRPGVTACGWREVPYKDGKGPPKWRGPVSTAWSAGAGTDKRVPSREQHPFC